MKVFIVFSALIVLQIVNANPVKRNCNGCVDDGLTYDVNATWVKDCITYSCISDGNKGIVGRKCVDPGNANLCRNVDDTWSGQVVNGNYGYCADYTCFQSSNNNILPYVSANNLRCRYNGTCFADGAHLDIANCNRLTCIVENNVVKVNTTATPGCSGTCTFTVDGVPTEYAAGATWLHLCHRYTCTGNSYTVERECCQVNFNYESLTFSIGEFTLEGVDCSGYYCHPDNGFTVSYTGCQDNTGSCRAVDETWFEGCFEYKCVQTGSTAYKSFISGGCSDNNMCRGVDETWMVMSANGAPYADTGLCYEKLCSFQNNIFSITINSTRCSVNGVCYDMGTEHDYQPENCKKVTCYKSNNQVVTDFPQKCKDSNGVCHEYGTFGWPYSIQGHQCNNCTCNEVGNTIAYSCTDY